MAGDGDLVRDALDRRAGVRAGRIVQAPRCWPQTEQDPSTLCILRTSFQTGIKVVKDAAASGAARISSSIITL